MRERVESNLLFLRDIKSLEVFQGRLAGLEIIFPNVRLEQDYEVIEQENGGNELKLGVVSTVSTKPEVAVLSDMLFNKLSEYSMNPQNVPLRTFLMGLHDCSYLERLAFYQIHALKGVKVDNKLADGELPSADLSSSSVSESLLGNCSCTYVVKATRDFGPGFPVNGTMNANDNIYSDYSPNWIEEGSTLRAYSNSGAAKWQQLHSSGSYSSGGMNWQNGSSGGPSPAFATIGYNLFCTNYPSQLPADCACDKSVPVFAKYNTKLNVNTTTSGCFFCWGNRNSVAMAEDWAVVVEHNIKTGLITPLAAGNASAKSECSTTINTDFFVKLVDIAGSIYAKSMQQEAQQGSVVLTILDNIQQKQFIDGLSDKIGQIIQTPIVNRVGCGSEEKTSTLMDLTTVRTLKANNPTYYTMYSASNLKSSGATMWGSDVRIISQFMLGGVLQMGTNPGEEFCCSSPVANWVSFTTPDLTTIRPSLESKLSFFWPQSGNSPTVTTDFGYKAGTTPFGCISVAQIARQNSDIAISIKQLSDGIYLNDLKSEVLDCTVSDILGRVVSHYKGESNNQKIMDFTTNTNSNGLGGIYVVKVNRKNGVSKTFKVVKN